MCQRYCRWLSLRLTHACVACSDFGQNLRIAHAHAYTRARTLDGGLGIMDGKRSFARVPHNDSHYGDTNVYGDNHQYAWLPLASTGPLATGISARNPWDPVAAFHWITGCVLIYRVHMQTGTRRFQGVIPCVLLYM